MKSKNRPEQIDKILKALDTDGGMTTELETYIADLEAKQPNRPSRIIHLLEEVESRYSAEAKVSLEAYISELEVKQQPRMPSKAHPSTESLYGRSVRREKERKARALSKQNGYQ